jgi:Mor family transcriptional regulator
MKKKTRKKSALANARKRKRETRRRRVWELYRQGYSCNKIAVRLNTNSHTIASDLHAMGRHVKTQKTKVKRNAALIKDRFNGKTILSLAKKYKISEDRVNEIIDNYNKVAKKPVPDFKTLREIRLKKHPKQKHKKRVPLKPITPKPITPKTTTPKPTTPKTTVKTTGSSEKEKTAVKKHAALRLKRIIAMRNAGSTVKMIAKQCSLTENRIYQLLKNANK